MATLTTDVQHSTNEEKPADELVLWRRWRDARDVAAREQLIARHLPYARTVAATYYGRRLHNEIEFGDYLQYARVGLLEALDRFDPEQGAQFRTFAARRMHGAIVDGLETFTEKQQQIALRQRLRRERVQIVKNGVEDNKKSKTERRERRQQSGDDLFRYLADVGIGLALCTLLDGTGMVDNSADSQSQSLERHYDPIELAQLHRRTLDAVEQLSAQQRTVIRYHYLQQHGFDDIATIMAVTRSRVSQIHRVALAELRSLLNDGTTCDVSL